MIPRARVLVTPYRNVISWRGETGTKKLERIREWSVVELGETLRDTYSTAAHFYPYHIKGQKCHPKLNKKVFPILEEKGYLIRYSVAALDVDTKPHAWKPDQAWRDRQEERLAALPWYKDVVLYHTKGGFRLVCRLTKLLTLDEYVEFTSLWRQSAWLVLKDTDIHIDKLSPYTGFVLPFARREDTGEDLRYKAIRLDEFETLPGLSTNGLRRTVHQFTKPSSILDDVWAKMLSRRTQFVLPSEIGQGERHLTLFSYAGYLRARGLGYRAILTKLKAADLQRCDPPLIQEEGGLAEIERMAERVVANYETGTDAFKVEIKRIQALAHDIKFKAPEGGALNYEGTVQDSSGLHNDVLEGEGPDWEDILHGVRETPEDKEPVEVPINRCKLRRSLEPPYLESSSETELAKWAIGEITDSPLDLIHSEGVLRLYSDKSGIWEPVRDLDVKQLIHSLDGTIIDKGTTAQGAPILERLGISDRLSSGMVSTLHTLTGVEDMFAEAPGGVAFSNGFLQIDKLGWQLKKKSKSNKALSYMDFPFEEGLLTPKFDAFLDYIMVGMDKAEKKVLIWEAMGMSLACLGTRMQKAFLLEGSGANGKSTLIDIWKAMMPKGSVTSIKPQDFGSDYKLAMLKLSLLNAVNETPEDIISDSSGIKAMISGDTVTARPIRQAPFAFRSRALQVFACNTLPKFKDLSGGFERRWLIIKFDRMIPLSERDPDIAADIIKSELGAIACKSLIAASHTLQRGKYLEPKSSIAARHSWNQDNNPLLDFIYNLCEDARISPLRQGVRVGTITKVLHSHYSCWCALNAVVSLTPRNFANAVTKLGYPQFKSRGIQCLPLNYVGD